VTGCKPNIKEMDREYLHARNTARRRDQINRISQTTDLLVSIAKEAGWLDWMSLRNKDPNSKGGKLSSWLDQYLNEDSWKQSLCNPLLIRKTSSTGDGGTIIQCKDNLCEPVFTQAIEKVKFNETHYMYILTYYIGGVQYPSMSSDEVVISYQAYLKSPSASVALFVDPDTKKPKNLELKNGEYVDLKTVLPLTKNNYNKLCFDFETPFPPHEPNAVTEICRKIYDRGDRGDSPWDTGSPTPADEYQLPSLNQTPNTGNNFLNALSTAI